VSSERSLLAQELHDSIAQSLAFLKIPVQLLRGALARGEAAAVQRTVGEIEAGVQESYGDVRELLVHFRTRADAEDIEPALRTTLRKFHLQTGIHTDIEIQGHGVALPNDVQIQVLHVVQEALSNIRKHASATRVKLRVQQAPAWRFEVCDNGAGFDPGQAIDESHVGLRIMSERAGRIGATLSIASEPGQGTTVSLSLPQLHAVVHAVEESPHVPADTPAGR
jgi:two-component system nitrate/nitrite sensor histidine kinase NarX